MVWEWSGIPQGGRRADRQHESAALPGLKRRGHEGVYTRGERIGLGEGEAFAVRARVPRFVVLVQAVDSRASATARPDDSEADREFLGRLQLDVRSARAVERELELRVAAVRAAALPFG